jgi:hypothetical protein
MITVQQLRIGNWIMDDDNPRQWSIYDYTTNPVFYTPIHLSPEILENKCGFEWETDKKTHLQKETIDGHLLCLYYSNGELYSVQLYTVDGADFYSHPATILKYLHQLQNLYFALTQTELIINL